MENTERIEAALEAALALQQGPEGPPLLAAAMRDAVFPGGARIRPHLTLAVAQACGADDLGLPAAGGAAIELMHCASLVHDDLPCFDNALTRRGRLSVFAAHGERLAVLAGDALIVAAFQSLAHAGATQPLRLIPMISTLSMAVGAPSGIIAGQAWECEPRVSLSDYQRAKTGALFVAATAAGAQAAGADAAPWRALGELLGEAYQVADDIRDVACDAEMLGKPSGQDVTHGRPSSAGELGLTGAVQLFDQLIAHASASIPACRGSAQLRTLLRMEAKRLVPNDLVRKFAPSVTRVVA
jgi:geranylgeranyl diphosphate synthase type II